MKSDDRKTLVDITRDVCPMTQVRVKMALAAAAPQAPLQVLLTEAALKSVVSVLKAEGAEVAAVTRQGEFFLLDVTPGGGVAP
jgi:TusA-related sulfurtransferase